MKKIILAVSLIAIIIISAPWMLYGIGLMNVSGRPERATISITDEESMHLWQKLGESGSVQVAQIGPWDYIIQLVAADPLQ